MPEMKYAIYKPVRPYFDLVRGALGSLVDGEHFFDCVAVDVLYEVLYDFPGWPRAIRGRADLMESFRGYGKHIALQSADHLIEYEVHGTILATGIPYHNRFCSIIRIENRRIASWRDYMDSLAAWNSLTSGSR
jgi:ketosteroid isomerase-like protein